MKTTRFWMIPVTALLAGFAGCSGNSEKPADDVEVVYFCRETRELLTAPSQPVPATNPRTGRKTLLRAAWCEECRRWYPTPPPEAYPGNPLMMPCPKHNKPLSPQGPKPRD